jgi:PPOX class probable F420-dependent enzyme
MPPRCKTVGMDTSTDLAAARLDRFLAHEDVLWLSSVGPDGAPHLVPTWFVWDGGQITIVSKPGARKVTNLRSDPRVMVAMGDPQADFDVGMLQAIAHLEPVPTAPGLPVGFAAKYGVRIAGLGLSEAQFAATYAQVIRLTPVRALGWHGRSRPRSVVQAARRLARRGPLSIAEPGTERPGLIAWLGEPVARRVDDRRPARAFSPV